MTTHLSLVAIPGVLILILLEYYLSIYRKKKLYEFKDAVSNISHGIFERFAYIGIGLVYFLPYQWIQQNWGIFDIETSISSWLSLVLIMDFCWYWYHRTGHTINFMWASHVVHHQSEYFNLSAGTRITCIQSLYRFLFYALLPLLGFPAEMIMSAMVFQGVYSLLTHTQLVGKLGLLEYIFVTPSHHRVHHANNEAYLDKNYGNLLIIWDYIFGTFQKEEETPTYGLTKQIETYDFFYGNFHFFFELYYAIKAQATLRSKLKIFFGSPTLLSGWERNVVDKRLQNSPKKRYTLPWFLRVNIQVRLLGILALSSILVAYHQNFNTQTVIYIALALITHFYQLGRIMQTQKVRILTELILVLFSTMVFSENQLVLTIPLSILLLTSGFSIFREVMNWLNRNKHLWRNSGHHTSVQP